MVLASTALLTWYAGWNTLYICGTDEYGTATEMLARKKGQTPREVCDEFYQVHTQVYKWFGISFDYWGRTPTQQHTDITQGLFLDLYKNGYIEEDSLVQLYCEPCDMFLADRFVEGTCPSCKYAFLHGLFIILSVMFFVFCFFFF